MPQLDLMMFFSELFWITIVLIFTIFSIKISLLPNLDVLTVSELVDIWSSVLSLTTRFNFLSNKFTASKVTNLNINYGKY